jgi:hypothetical protein
VFLYFGIERSLMGKARALGFWDVLPCLTLKQLSYAGYVMCDIHAFALLLLPKNDGQMRMCQSFPHRGGEVDAGVCSVVVGVVCLNNVLHLVTLKIVQYHEQKGLRYAAVEERSL